MDRFIGVAGIIVFVLLAFLLSEKRNKISWKLVGWGMILQVVLALLVLGIPALGYQGLLHDLFVWANDAIIALLKFTEEGSRFIFGQLLDFEKSGFIFAFQVLPTIIFMASLMAILYHMGVMQIIVRGIAWVMQRTMGISGAESLSVAANIFVGQTEAPLVVRPYVATMTRSELLAVMTGGMATVAGGVMAAYVMLLKDRIPDIAGHLLTASVMSAPAALAIAKLLIPETKTPETLGSIPKGSKEKVDRNLIEAAARGAGEGLSLALNVAAMLLAFIALIALINAVFKTVGVWIGFETWGVDAVPHLIRGDKVPELTFEVVLGWIFAPMAWIMGIPWEEAGVAGTLLGEKIVLNEFVAYLHLSQLASHLSDRSVVILSYALCGFANFSSIAIQIGGIGGIAPTRKSDLAELGIRSVIGGSLAAFLTATIAGILI
ncbi:MAG: NupC/NupG family nucleoside CNT transporter [Bdellovibrionaceae bacterium]|nr:hypothetical protein [Bdellovibrionales bacterium]MCB9082792.1 NupC/NupG family nucleoside CNT transporter [Pseudobdellovibrionaceae bacterium]